MYNKHGIQIKEASKFAMTFIVTNVNFNYGDVGTKEWYSESSQLVKIYNDYSIFNKEAGDLFAEKYVTVLDELYKTKT